MNTAARIVCAALLGAAVAGSAMAAKVDLDYQRLTNSLDQLRADPVLGRYAQAERTLARQAVDALLTASKKRRSYVLYIAERRVDLAKATAELDDARQQLVQLKQAHDQILLEASRRDAAATRRALERERLQNQLAAEQAERLQAQGEAATQAAQKAQAEADQAKQLAASQAHAAALARHEANLAESAVKLMRQQLDHLTARRGAEGMQMTLGGIAFASGKTTLRPEAKAHLGKLVQFVQSQPDKHVRIEGYTDASGNAATNQTLSLRRAQAVRSALVDLGVDPARMTAVGMGESNPVASNATPAGRAENRRVVVVLQDK